MLDADITAADARRLLSVPAGPSPRDVGGWSRRDFLRAVGFGVVGGAALGTFGDGLLPFGARDAFAAPPLGPSDHVVITIVLYGGNDGLNTVVPYTDPHYYRQRPAIAIAPRDVLALDAKVGLHPSLVHLKQRFDAGQVAVVQGVGYPNADLSHFTSMAIWMSGRYGPFSPATGWIGRWLDGQPAAVASLGAVAIDSSVGLHLIGAQQRGAAVSPYGELFGTDQDPPDVRMYDGLRAMAGPSGRGAFHELYASALTTQLDLARDVSPVFDTQLPERGLPRKLAIAARLVNANLGMRVIDVGLGGFDHHDDLDWQHRALLTELDEAIRTFYETLEPAWHDRVTLVTLSEFGRTSYANGSGGTDHGTASNLFVIGGGIRGGLYGQQPRLDLLDRWGRVEHHVDFRSVFGTIIDRRMGGGASTVLNGSFEDLGLFTTGPSDPLPPVVDPPAVVSSGVVPILPVRAVDTRTGAGGRRGAFRSGEAWTLPVVGRTGVPAGASAVLARVTVSSASRASALRIGASGDDAAAVVVETAPGTTQSTVAVLRIGADGAVVLRYDHGSAHIAIDVLGWLTPAATAGLVPLAPARLLDTRVGTGGVRGPLTSRRPASFTVAGRGDVAASDSLVLLQVTTTSATGNGTVTLWPSGTAKPTTPSGQVETRRSCSMLVPVAVGSDGKVNVAVSAGSCQVLVDVVGVVRPGAALRVVPVPVSRVVDTRTGVGVATRRLDTKPLSITLTGAGGLPASGVAAALLKVTATRATTTTAITVHPAGQVPPGVVHVSTSPGRLVTNLVLVPIGTDGAVVVRNQAGATDIAVDVVGYLPH